MDACLVEYQKRQAHLSDPGGDFSFDGLWLPDKDEWCDCCRNVPAPSRHLWFTLQHHCRSLEHICALLECDERFVRDRWRRIQRGDIENPLEADIKTWAIVQERNKTRQKPGSFQTDLEALLSECR